MIAWLLLVQSVAASPPMDLDAALARALSDGVDAREAAFAEASAESARSRSRAAFLPNLGLSASGGVTVGATGVGPGASASLSSTTALYAGGSLIADRRAADAALDAAHADSAEVRQDLRLALAEAMLDLGSAEAQASVAASTFAAEEALAVRIAALVAAGVRTRADALQENVAVAKARAGVVTARLATERATLALEELLRLDPAQTWTFTVPTPPSRAGALAPLLEEAAAHRADLVAATARERVAEADLRSAASGSRPSVDLVVGATTGTAGVPGDTLDRSKASASIQVNVPIFDRGVAHDVQTQARLALDAATLRREALEESVEYDVRGALLDHEAARALFDVAGARVEAADAALAVVQDRYEAGAGTFAELLAARAEAAAAARDRVVAHHQALRAAFVLAWAVGAE